MPHGIFSFVFDAMALWNYNGPVMRFGIRSGNYTGATVARTAKEAMRNFTYQAKGTLGLLPSARIELSSKYLSNKSEENTNETV